MKSGTLLKKQSLGNLKGQWGYGVLLCLIILVLNFIVFNIIGLIEIMISNDFLVMILGFAVFLASCPVTVGISAVFLKLVRGDGLKPTEVFMPYTRMLLPAMFTMAVKMAYTMLWTMLFIIPGIVKSISYSQTAYILIDNPALSPAEAITKSRKMMNGFKWTYLKMWLSFFGWFLLSLFTFGIGFLWLMPYVQTTLANFHLELKAHHEEVGTFKI